MEALGAPTEYEERISEVCADDAIAAIDAIITEIYMPMRGAKGYGTERAILPEEPHMSHRENIAEHSFHLPITIKALYDNREQFGLEFSPTFDVRKAMYLAVIHDVPEVWAEDVDALTADTNLLTNKAIRERAAVKLMRVKLPFLEEIATDWLSYEHKDTEEAMFVSDVDKIISTRMICLDGGRRWHDWNGQQASREFMCRRMREKLLTVNGHMLFDSIERDLDRHPEYFPAAIHSQGTLF